MRTLRSRSMYLLAILLVSGPPVWAEEEATNGTSVVVVVTGLRNSEGQVIVSLYGSGAGFPGGEEGIVATRRTRIENARAQCTFDNVAPGGYAIAVIHDEDANDKLKTNIVGMPKEGTGASNNPKSRFGPPKWDDAKFLVEETQVTLDIAIKYL